MQATTADERAHRAAVAVVTGGASADDLAHVHTYLRRHGLRMTGHADTDAATVIVWRAAVEDVETVA